MMAFCKYRFFNWVTGFFAGLLFLLQSAFAQNNNLKHFRVNNNVMYITLAKNLPPASLDSFIQSYTLNDIGLYTLLQSGNTDSVLKSGWKLESDNFKYTLTKTLNSGLNLNKSSDRIVFSSIPTPDYWRVVGGNKVVYGTNKFRSNDDFRREGDVTYFVLKGFKKAKSVKIAGSFTNWQHGAFPLSETDEGWMVPVRLAPGQYFYKFIVDGRWITDPVNLQNENDGFGNINSVYFVPNKILFLKGYETAKTVTVTGSFNNWSKEGLPMQKKPGGWEIALYLEEGTHRYQILVDGHPVKENDENQNDQNKISFGKSFEFELKGFKNANKVVIAGDFNGWKPDEILMKRTDEGWKIDYVLGPGNYQYKFIVDGKWITDPANPNIVSDGNGNLNSYIVVAPNYTFRLKGFSGAKKVQLAGEFNNWSPEGLAMTKVGDEWVAKVYLGRGKHLYKFIVDGKWIKDPNNPLWEDGVENSVLWIE